ncbi:MAG: glutamate--tRNA ligase, partial [Erythrobacter sp.]
MRRSRTNSSDDTRSVIERLARPPRIEDVSPIAARFVFSLRLIALHDRARRDPVPELAARLGSVDVAAKALALGQAVSAIWPENVHVSRFCCSLLSHDELTVATLIDSASPGPSGVRSGDRGADPPGPYPASVGTGARARRCRGSRGLTGAPPQSLPPGAPLATARCMTTTRFAPSPTGRLHVGNIRTALHNWMLARQSGGTFVLRIDDTDAERSKEEYVEAIREDLAWLGLAPDREERQSSRLDSYERAFARLRDEGRIYPAYETQQELELKRKIRLGRGLPPIYDRAALEMSDDKRAAKEADGVKPHWRFKLDHDEPIRWDDGIRGAQKFDPAQLSDPVIRRADGSWLYMLPSTVDDIDMGVTQVLRGEDHVSNTAVQLQMFTALSARPPAFAHEALLVGKEGKLSKRLGSLGCDAFRERGIEPEAIIALLARLGTSL